MTEKKTDKFMKLISYINKNNPQNNNKSARSFSPSINNKLNVKKLRTLKIRSVKLCDNLLKLNLGTRRKKKCSNFNTIEVKKFLLKNLMASKHLDPDKFIAPKQLYSNCWFNTLFVVFFFSDKGRKFLRFFRNLMITGKKYDNTRLEDQELRKLLFVFNLYIEASYNQDLLKVGKNKINLHMQVKELTNNLETNYLIKKIYNQIKKNSEYYSIPNIDEAGNPLDFYKQIMKYLKYDIIKMLNINIRNKNKSVKDIITAAFNAKHDIITIEDHESKINYAESYEIEYEKNKYTYLLDSIIITNTDHYDQNKNSHFVAVLTINKIQYKFDGSSYARLSKFNWKQLLNQNKNFTFKENPKYYSEKYNFTKGYKILFYYRI